MTEYTISVVAKPPDYTSVGGVRELLVTNVPRQTDLNGEISEDAVGAIAARLTDSSRFNSSDRQRLRNVDDRTAQYLDAPVSSRATPSDVQVSGQFTSADRTLLEDALKKVDYTAPDNTTIGNIETLLNDRLDIAVSTRSTLTASDIPEGLTADDVWQHTTRTLTDDVGLTAEQAKMVRELWQIMGLDPTSPLSVSDTARAVAAIRQVLTDDGQTTTVTRK